MLTLLFAFLVCGGGHLADSPPESIPVPPEIANRPFGDAIYLSFAPEDEQAPRPYVRGGLLFTFGHEWEGVNFDSGFGAYIAGGFQWDVSRQVAGDTLLCADVQYMYRTSEFKEFVFDPFGGGLETIEGQFTFHSVLLNAVLVVNATDPVCPYFGFGAGLSYGILEVEDEDDDGIAPELQAMIGMLVRVRDNIHAELGASYTIAFHTLEDESGDSSSAPVDLISLNFGVRVRL